MRNELNFKISAALKNIIGRDLINDDFIAVFELVKNAYDAHATQVDITFEHDAVSNNFNKIIISDNGKGMNYFDLVNKWLFVAYSAKKEGTEENNYRYRDRIKVKRAYAGAKGIGRFSCDRLGSNLYLETIKEEEESKVEALITDWEKFDNDLNDEFINISVLHETLSKSSYGKTKGTVLEITNLRSLWDRDKLLRLKGALAKLINPNNQKDDDNFKIKLIVDAEKIEDNLVLERGKKKKKTEESIYKDIVNGEIQNLIFETLDLKTTKIVSKVSNDDTITTELFEGGKLVYSIVEENKNLYLHDVDFIIYYLNRSSKLTFSKRMGLQPVEYGHIFVYKNGLRIYPYGERGEDPLKMDNRKAQGTARYIGTRESIGYIDIGGENQSLVETSSRGDGLIKTQAYQELYQWFYTTLRRLERYVVEVSDWGKDLSEDDYINLDETAKVYALQNLVQKLARSQNLISINYSDDLFEILELKEEDSTKKILEDIKDRVNNKDFNTDEIISSVRKIEKKLTDLKTSKDEAEEETLRTMIENEKLTSQIDAEIKRNLWTNSIVGTDKEKIIALQHQIFHSSSRINRNIGLLLKQLRTIEGHEKFNKFLSVISLESAKINSIANYITKANFNLKATEINEDLIEFTKGYINEIYLSEDKVIDTPMNLQVNIQENLKYKRRFIPLEITSLIDNFINNSEKSKASVLEINFDLEKNNIILSFYDNGKNYIPEENYDKIFDLGFSTTNGSGIGLFQIKEIIKKLNGIISVESIKNVGTTFKIILPYEN
ncbi:ATP-binding protein [Chryseobacterium sp. FH1]|uniref:ATP-binding protein n=1 Tax=Chryseobacterium sp. FH1 TaxID=1233951 RepID=UPI0004E36C58|nr:ATP-binding protein [Chryseobacterium sp. FH1]KFC19315.1 histidine kinase [Chryseobacterium sp. FH1]